MASEQLDPEAVDLAALASTLRDRFGAMVEGFVVGRTRLRDELVVQLSCSALEAERLIDTMIQYGIVEEREVDGRKVWAIREL